MRPMRTSNRRMQPSTLLARMALLTATTLVTSSCSRDKTRRSLGKHAHEQKSAGYARNATGELAAMLVGIAVPTATTLVTTSCDRNKMRMVLPSRAISPQHTMGGNECHWRAGCSAGTSQVAETARAH